VLSYELKKQFHATVMKNGHVCLGPDKHYYSVPYRFIGKKIKLLYSSASVEAFYHYERIAMHKRTRGAHLYTTEDDHMASAHQFVTDWSKDKFLGWAASIHEDVRLYIHNIFDRKRHAEQAYKSCLGILGFSRKVGNERLILACRRGLSYGIYNYNTINMILEKNMDQYEDSLFAGELPMPDHDNIRGEDYYK
jgi:hypothetical protein